MKCNTEQVIGAKAETARFMTRDLRLDTLFSASLNSGVRNMSKVKERQHDELKISTNRDHLDFKIIHHLLTTETYWARERSLEVVRRSFENSLPFVILKGAETVGWARVVSDYATFAWLADVFIRREFRGLGLGKWLIETIISHQDLKDLRRFLLATRDAHELYRQFGFDDLRIPQLWMERTAPNAYASFELEENLKEVNEN